MGAPEDPDFLTLGEAERLYAAARLLSLEERAAYLEGACAGRPELLAELTSLVEHGDAAESFPAFHARTTPRRPAFALVFPCDAGRVHSGPQKHRGNQPNEGLRRVIAA